MKKYLIINPFGVGDVIFTTALINAIKESEPFSSVSYWCNSRVKDIFKDDPRIDKVFALTRGDLKKIFEESVFKGICRLLNLLAAIKKEKFDSTIDFSLDSRYGFISFLLGIRKRIGLNYKKRGVFLTHRINICGYSDKHVAEYYLDLLRFIDNSPLKSKPYNLKIFVSENNSIKARIIFERAGIKDIDTVVAVSPGAGASWGRNASFKHWSAIKYAQLADKIINVFKAKVLIIGDISEQPIADIVVTAMKNQTVNLTGKIGLPELFAVLKNTRLLITNDGGPLHIASALGIRTVSIFGPVDERVYGPYPLSDEHIVVKKDIACRPCYQKFKMPVCSYNKECLNALSTDEVFEAVRRQLCEYPLQT